MNLAGALSVIGHGMVTAAGRDGPSTFAALRANISGVRTANLWDPTAGKKMGAGRPVLHQWSEGPETIGSLVTLAAQECLARYEAEVEADEIPMVVLLSPSQRPHRWPSLDDVVLRHLTAKFGTRASRMLLAHGSTGIIRAIEIAAELMQGRGSKRCLIIGAESFLRQSIVRHYIDNGRLLCGANSNGFIPGEAACAVLIARSGSTQRPELVISGLGSGVEPSGTGGDAARTSKADGLTLAVRSALELAQLPFWSLNYTISDINGERYKFKEAVIARGRLDRAPPPGVPPRPAGYMEVWHPIEGTGEIGAAIFPCMLGWAFEASSKGYAPGESALLHASEENGERAALITRFQGSERLNG
jgi:3-oxoacyl-[acyl-carrier-protein] synthase-1